MKLRLISEASSKNIETLFTSKSKLKNVEIHKLLGFKQPLTKIAEGSFATIYEFPNNKKLIIKITTHKEDVANLVKAQRLNSNNIVKLHQWPDGKLFKALPQQNAWAIIVDYILGSHLKLSTGHLLKLAYNGNFEFAKEWLEAGGSIDQINILKLYNLDNDSDISKLAELFETMAILQRYGIDISDIDENIIEQEDRYVIIDLGF